MAENTIPEWAVEKAHTLLKQEAGLSARFETYTRQSVPVKALARVISEYQEPPVDPLLIEARKLAASARQKDFATCSASLQDNVAVRIANGEWDDHMLVDAAFNALKRGMELAGERT